MLLLLWHHLPSKKSYRVAQLADNPPKLLCTDKASLTWQPGSHNNLDSLDTYLDLKRQGQSSQSHISSRVNVQHIISTWTDVTLSRIGRQITDSLGVIIVGFRIILLEIKSIALLFEAFCFPALKVGDTTGERAHKTDPDRGFIVKFIVALRIQYHMLWMEMWMTAEESTLASAGYT